jgi:arginine repressor
MMKIFNKFSVENDHAEHDEKVLTIQGFKKVCEENSIFSFEAQQEFLSIRCLKGMAHSVADLIDGWRKVVKPKLKQL